jgi:dTDP-4-amino-4,6-dideoxygalactose transaminase
MDAVPVADPLRLDLAERAAISDAVAAVLETGPLVLGAHVERFEQEFGAHLDPSDAPEVVGVGNGSDALAIALTALALPGGCAVLVPANDGGFAAGAVRAAGLVPIATDVDLTTQLVDTAALDRAWTPAVRAVVVTHLHGQPVDAGPITAWCREHGLPLVEDAAQAHGAWVDGRRAGTVGDVATFSFYPTKNLGAVGDGGAVVTRDPDLAGRARRLRQYGWGERFRVDVAAGRNSRLDALQAAVLTARLPFLDDNNERRRAVVGRYRAALAGSDAVVLGDAPGAVAHHAVVVHPGRDRLVEVLARAGIGTSIHYPWLVTEMPGLAMTSAATPGADRGRRDKLSLPCFPTLAEAELDRVATALAEWGRQGG